VHEGYPGNLSEFRQSGEMRCVDAQTPYARNPEIPRKIYVVDLRKIT
jgi:hypothetical protein